MVSLLRLAESNLASAGVDGGGMRMTASALSSVHGSRRNFVGSEKEDDDESEGDGEVVREEDPDSEGDVHDDEVDIRREV